MTKKLLVLSSGLFVLLALVLTASTGETLRVTPVPEAERIEAQRPEAPKDYCFIDKSNGVAASFFGGFTTGMANVTYYNPEVCGFTPTYPFEITAFSFTLYNAGGMSWPVQVDVVVYDLAVAGDSCSGPAAELCRVTVSCDQVSFEYPNYGTVNFPDPCCVNGPFYAGIEYTDPGSGPFLSILYDNQTADTCDNWFYYAGAWREWFTVWNPPVPGYPLFELHGETNSPNCEPCDWQPGDPHKMHHPQLPDEEGWDVMATQPIVLADDWECSEDGWIKDFHFWGSWKHGIEGQILYFTLSIHSNDPGPPSMPDVTLWEREVWDFGMTPVDPPSMEGWYDPSTGEIIYEDHQAYFQYNVCLDSLDWYWQDSGVVYWLNISAVLADPIATSWGWKSTQDHFMDDAVWAYWGDLAWVEIFEPTPIQRDSNEFWIAIDPDGAFDWGGGTDYFGVGWYFYPWYDWWNIWFYDAPFSYDRYKKIHIEFFAQPYDGLYPFAFDFAVNWSTDQWSLDQPPADSAPPLPGVDEDAYIGRHILVSGADTTGYYIFDYVIPDYNPEWVSIDVRGINFGIEWGYVVHECIGTEPQSLDLSFVVTGGVEDSGACCYPDPSGLSGDVYCVVTTQYDCETNLGGSYQGDDTECSNMQACCLSTGACVDADSMCCVDELGGEPQGFGTQCTATEACCYTDGSCQDLDPLCCVELGGVPQGSGTQCTVAEACCMPNDQCRMLDPLCCVELGGAPQGLGTACTAPEACCMPLTATCQDLDPLCCINLNGIPQGAGTQCTAPEACCMPGGGCQNLDPLCCDEMGGSLSPIGAPACLGDNDQNGVDDACEGGWIPGDPHKMHYPQLPDEAGWDVNATYPMVLADDWQCSQKGPVSDFHFWGSWKHGVEAEITAFILSIHSNISETESPTGYSIPGPILWEMEVDQFGVVPFDPPTAEGWYDPNTQEVIADDHQAYYQYNVYIADSSLWFQQEKDSIYWLNISAIVNAPGGFAQWGWKSSQDHFMDDAVWSLWGEDFWIEMYEPGPTTPNPIVNPFYVIVNEQGMVIEGAGEGAYGEGWYYYPWYDWWNIWFYDHPFAPERYKTIHIEIEVFPYMPSPTWFELAVNWSTDAWSLQQPPGDSAPPLPGVDEDLYIGREVLFVSDYPEGHYVFDYEIPEYNPEWVSIDVRGFNFIIMEGFIEHECVGPQSLDLSFVITGEGPCDCVPGDANNSGSFNILDVTYLLNYLYKGGSAPVPYALCSGDADCRCSINILDVTFLINYLYKGGNPPCDCPTWLSNCGPPLRK